MIKSHKEKKKTDCLGNPCKNICDECEFYCDAYDTCVDELCTEDCDNCEYNDFILSLPMADNADSGEGLDNE